MKKIYFFVLTVLLLGNAASALACCDLPESAPQVAKDLETATKTKRATKASDADEEKIPGQDSKAPTSTNEEPDKQ